MLNGLLLVDKPEGMSSHDVVYSVRRQLKQKEVGHAGTLDPAATGLLVVLMGQATKLSNYILNGDKAYEATVQLGIKTTTGDKEGDVVERKTVDLSEEQIRAAVESLKGTFTWAVPIFSAVKRDGKKLYELARNGEEVIAPEKTMVFHEVKYLSTTSDEVKVYLKCSKGSFIRTWAEKLGEKLNVGGSLKSLRRVESDPYNLQDAISLEQIEQGEFSQTAGHWVPISQGLPGWPQLKVDGHDEKLIKNGQIPHRLARYMEIEYLGRGHRQIKVVSRSSAGILALVAYQEECNSYRLSRVFR